MTNLERLDAIIEILDNYHSQLIIDGHEAWADKVAYARDEMQWLYYMMDKYN